MRDTTVNIVGVGNVLMGDDGVGVVAVEALSRRALPDGARVHEAGLAFSDVVGRLDPRDPLIVLDAVRGGGPPGSVYRLACDEAAVAPGTSGMGVSLHELSVAPALRLEALGGRAFEDVTVFGVEPDPESIAWGEGLSPRVAEGVDRLVEAVIEHVAERTADSMPAAPVAGDSLQ